MERLLTLVSHNEPCGLWGEIFHSVQWQATAGQPRYRGSTHDRPKTFSIVQIVQGDSGVHTA